MDGLIFSLVAAAVEQSASVTARPCREAITPEIAPILARQAAPAAPTRGAIGPSMDLGIDESHQQNYVPGEPPNAQATMLRPATTRRGPRG